MPPKRKRVALPPGAKSRKKGKRSSYFLCTHCVKSFKTEEKLEKHKIICLKLKTNLAFPTKNVIICKECNKRFRFKKSYAAHLKNEHSKTPGSVKCDKCPVSCPDKKTLREHIQKIHNREIYECPHCKKEFVRRSHVMRHMAQTGCDGKGVSVFPCDICNASFSRKDNLMVHLRMQHMNFYACKQCDFKTKNFSKLILHWQRYHADPPQYYECDHCGKATSSRAAIAKHLEIHGEKKFECEVAWKMFSCSYSTFTIEVMRRHVLTHVTEKPYKCNVCDRSYIQRAQLQRHFYKHTGNTCLKCGEKFDTKARLIIHERTHQGLKKLTCPISSCVFAKKEFSSDAALDNHVKTHGDDKPYECAVCSKKFPNEVNMRRHMSTHALDRPRRCMYCVSARAYVRGEQLVRHVRQQHQSVFKQHLMHVRQVLGVKETVDRVRKSEMQSILNVLDAESERILEGYGEGVLYGGMVEQDDEKLALEDAVETNIKKEENPLMSEEVLAESLQKLLSQLIDEDTLQCLGWPEETVDVVLEKVIEGCGAKAADRERWTRVQRLRENAKHLFLYVIEDKNIARMLETHTIDQIVKHILTQVE